MARAQGQLLLALAVSVGCAAALRKAPGATTCEHDDIAFARLTQVTCQMNWILMRSRGVPRLAEAKHMGCWDMLGYNTDKFTSSTLYQNKEDGRCALAFSGYHGKLAGYIRGALALMWPPMTWDICGAKVYAPYARLLRHHTSLGNWSKLVHLMAGPQSTCQGELSFMAESMGGSSGEILAYCANAGRLHELQDASLPSFKLQTLYTYGAPASAAQPLTNTLREDGCFKGKRIFFSGDPIAGINKAIRIRHPRMDAVEIWPDKQPAIQVYPCKSNSAVTDDKHKKPPPVQAASQTLVAGDDAVEHSVDSYMNSIAWMHKAGLGELFDADPLPEHAPNTTVARWLSMLQSQPGVLQG
mmetsp:Transcript_52542/g.163148  ORF Transcript_52542/g.163148 Transcript_52542/m.163148 type:complete len:356 (-) Transcript_52542:76-1143(-)